MIYFCKLRRKDSANREQYKISSLIFIGRGAAYLRFIEAKILQNKENKQTIFNLLLL